MQTCRTCGETKPLMEFDVRADTGKHRTVCKDCRRERQRLGVAASQRRTRYIVGTDELLLCRVCGELKPWTDFPKRGRLSDRLQTWCKPCFAAYKAARHQREHEREMQRIRRNQAIRVAENRALLNAYLSTHPCVDCGETDPAVLDFDHVRGEKLHDVSMMVFNGYPWAKIELEIAKCDVRCANDHRRVTAQRRRIAKGLAEEPVLYVIGDPGAIRTPDQQLRRLLL